MGSKDCVIVYITDKKEKELSVQGKVELAEHMEGEFQINIMNSIT